MLYKVYNRETKEWRIEKQKWVIYQRSGDINDFYKVTISPGWRCAPDDNLDDGDDYPEELAQWICDQLNNSTEKCPFVNDGFGWQKRALPKSPDD
jgi:hypothetical protein